jgi:hypothetical protein
VIDAIAAALGVASAIAGVACVLLFAFALELQISGPAWSRLILIQRITDPSNAAGALGLAALGAAPGFIGYAIARRRLRAASRISLAAVACRFALVGIALSCLLAAVAASVAVWRWLAWG